MGVLLSSFNYKTVLISLWISAFIQFSFSNKLFSFHEIVCFLLFCCCEYPVWNHHSQLQGNIQFSNVFSDFLWVLICDHFWRKFHEMLTSILFCVWMKWSVDVCYVDWFMMLINSRISLFSFCLHDQIGESKVLKSPTIIVWGWVCDSRCVSFMIFRYHCVWCIIV